MLFVSISLCWVANANAVFSGIWALILVWPRDYENIMVFLYVLIYVYTKIKQAIDGHGLIDTYY